jgi:hypothetical protein
LMSLKNRTLAIVKRINHQSLINFQFSSGSFDFFKASMLAYGHSSFFLNSQFSKSANQLGLIQLQSSGGVTGVGLRMSPQGSFTSIPIIR